MPPDLLHVLSDAALAQDACSCIQGSGKAEVGIYGAPVLVYEWRATFVQQGAVADLDGRAHEQQGYVNGHDNGQADQDAE